MFSSSAQGFGRLLAPLASRTWALPKPGALAEERGPSGQARPPFLLFKSESQPPAASGFSRHFSWPWSPRDRTAGGVCPAPDPVEKDGTEHGFLERCQAAVPEVPGNQATEIVAAGPIHEACCRESARSEEERGPTKGQDLPLADQEVTLPDSFKIMGCNSEKKQLSGGKSLEQTWFVRLFCNWAPSQSLYSLRCGAKVGSRVVADEGCHSTGCLRRVLV